MCSEDREAEVVVFPYKRDGISDLDGGEGNFPSLEMVVREEDERERVRVGRKEMGFMEKWLHRINEGSQGCGRAQGIGSLQTE